MAARQGLAQELASAWTACLLLCVALALGPTAAQDLVPVVSKNGVRIVLGRTGAGSVRGRLEVQSSNLLYGQTLWRPVCASTFDDSQAQIMCEMLGYSSGRTYYTRTVAYRDLIPNGDCNSAWSERPVGYLRCEARAPSRRHLQQRAATGRQLLRSLAMADLDAPPSSPYTCQFAGGGCPYIGPMAGVECTNRSFRPASPPPPSPPSPPDTRAQIRLVGNPYGPDGGGSPIEPNLCSGAEDADACARLMRVEVLVKNPLKTNELVWAPVCAPSDPALAVQQATLACLQAAGSYGASGMPGEALPVPSTAGGPDEFTPANYPAWVSYSSSFTTDCIKTFQKLKVRIAKKPCARLLTVAECAIIP